MVFGARLTGELTVSRARHRSTGLPAGLGVVSGNVEDLRALHRVAPLGTMYAESAAMAAVMQAEAASYVAGRPEAGKPADYLPNTVGIVAALAEAHGPNAVVSDLNAHFLRQRAVWEHEVFRHDPIDPRSLVQIFESAEGAVIFLSTRGMRTLGAPDIAVPFVTADWRDAAVAVVERFILMAAQGIAPQPGRRLTAPGLPDGIAVTEGMDDYHPYFDNRHVTLQQPSGTRH